MRKAEYAQKNKKNMQGTGLSLITRLRSPAAVVVEPLDRLSAKRAVVRCVETFPSKRAQPAVDRRICPTDVAPEACYERVQRHEWR